MTDSGWTANLTRADFRRFFATKYWALFRAAIDPAKARPDYANPAVVEGILASFDGLRHESRQTPAVLPRRIFMLWQQGWDNAPPLVRACAQSWRTRNPGWKLDLVDGESLHRLAPEFDRVQVHNATRQAQSDVARLALLARHGGVWADASVFCTWPLDEWLPALPADGAFMMTWPRPYRNVESWFMAAAPGNALVTAWLDLAARYWQLFSRPLHYYWLHYLFEYLLHLRADLRPVWGRSPEISAIGPHIVQGRAFDGNAPEPTFRCVGDNLVPMHKLSHKWRYKGNIVGTPLGRLTGLERLRK